MNDPAMKTALFACLVVFFAGLGGAQNTAGADPLPRLDGGLRVWAAWGTLEEMTWAYPGVDLVGTLRFGPSRRGFIDLQLGYAPLDNHTFLADGRMMRLGMAGGVRLLASKALRLSGMFALDVLAFHADPDVLADHPGVDLVASRGGVFPTLGLEASHDVRASMAVGVFGRAGLNQVALFDQPGGEERRARLVLAGFFVEFRLR